jgi:hypothetical protein
LSLEEAAAADSDSDLDQKEKKLVFLSKSVLTKVRERPMVTGTQIAIEIFEMYQKFVEVSVSYQHFRPSINAALLG